MSKRRGVALLATFGLFAAACADESGSGQDSSDPTSLSDSLSDSVGDGDGDGDEDTGEDKLDVLGGDTEGEAEGGEVCDQNVDIVFVMDVSTTMGPFFDVLEQEISVVDAALSQLNLPDDPHYGLVVFVDDYLTVNGGTPYTDVETLRADFEMWNQFTATNSQTSGNGFNSTWPENSIDGLYAAATEFQWRPAADTLRVVIHTTDDTFWDGPTTQDGVQILHGYEETVDALQAAEIRTYSFAALLGSPCSCEDVSMGWSTPYMGMDPVPEATDGGWWDIDEVLAGNVSLSDGINGAIEDKHCTPYPPTD